MNIRAVQADKNPRKPLHDHDDDSLPEVDYIYDEAIPNKKEKGNKISDTTDIKDDISISLEKKDNILNIDQELSSDNEQVSLSDDENEFKIYSDTDKDIKSEELSNKKERNFEDRVDHLYAESVEENPKSKSSSPQIRSKNTQKKIKLRKKNSFRLGIVGGKATGKTYLFHSMVYRLESASQAGALSYFLKNAGNASLYVTDDKETKASQLNYTRFNQEFEKWFKLQTTLEGTQKWYRLSIPYQAGIFNHSIKKMDVEFFDGSGEVLQTGNSTSRRYWEDNFSDVSVMVFCLPLWAALPSREMRTTESRWNIIDNFKSIVKAFEELRKNNNIKIPVKSILALTMADETHRTSLNTELVDSWLKPYMLKTSDHEIDKNFFRKLNGGGVINRYLANARKTSTLLNRLIESSDRLSSRIPQSLRFGAGDPWIIPVSAVRGDFLDQIQAIEDRPDNFILPEHNPAHVELPLLVALCEKTNAIM